MSVNNNKNRTDSGDDLGKVQFFGTDGANVFVAAEIVATADANASTGAVPGKLTLRTADSTGVMTDRLSINSSGAATVGFTRASRVMCIPVLNGKVGATAGWLITATDDISHATLPASKTDSTLVVPISGLFVGDTVTAVAAGGQIESAGGEVTLVMSVRKLTNAAADNTDAEIGADNVGTVIADTALSSSNLGATLATPEVLAAGESLYVLFTGTTAASTDIDLTHLLVTVTQA